MESKNFSGEWNLIETAIVISSCDLYKDCWKPILFSIEKNWPDLHFPLYIISNNDSLIYKGVTFLKIGEHLGWGSNTKKALEQLSQKYIIYLQEDYFIEKKIDTNAINEHLNYCDSNNVDYLRLGWPFRDNKKIEDTIYCNDNLNERYAVCLQPAIWSRESLLKFCLPGWTGWDFERNVSSLIRKNNLQFKSIVLHSSMYDRKGIYITDGTAIRKGRWTLNGADFLSENGFKDVLVGRKIEGRLLTYLMHVKSKSLFKFPAALIVRFLQYTGINL